MFTGIFLAIWLEISGVFGASPAQNLVNQATAFQGFSDRDLQIAKAYSLAVYSGLAGLTAGTVMTSAYSQGYGGLSDNGLQVVQAYALAQGLISINVNPNTNSTTYGLQEAFNAVPAGGPQWGTNMTGALIELGPGDFYLTNAAFYSNTFPYYIKLRGAGYATRLIYAGLGTTTNGVVKFCGGGNPAGGLNLPGHVEVCDLTITSITNMQGALLVITNSSYEYVHNVNFTDWELLTNNLHGPSVSIDGPAPTQAPGNVGLVIGQTLDHATIIEDCFFAGLACGIDVYGDHLYANNIKSAFIGVFGAGVTLGTAWANTSPYSLGPLILTHGSGIDNQVYNIHGYIVNTCFMHDATTGGKWQIYNPVFESVSHGFAEFNPGTSLISWFVCAPGVLVDDLGGPSWAVGHAPYSLSASTAVDLRQVEFSRRLSSTALNGNNTQATNFSFMSMGTLTVTGAVSTISFATNLMPIAQAPDFKVPVSLFSTNNIVVFQPCTNVDAGKTLYQKVVVFVTNTTPATPRAIIAPVNCRSNCITINGVGGIPFVTNLTRCTFEQYAQLWTNMTTEALY